MVFLWFVAGASLVVAVTALSFVRRLARRHAQLSEMYWQLKYQHGELRAQLQRVADSGPKSPDNKPPSTQSEAFVPLASLKR